MEVCLKQNLHFWVSDTTLHPQGDQMEMELQRALFEACRPSDILLSAYLLWALKKTKFRVEGLASADLLIWLVSCLLCCYWGSLIKMIAFSVLCWATQALEKDHLLRCESLGQAHVFEGTVNWLVHCDIR